VLCEKLFSFVKLGAFVRDSFILIQNRIYLFEWL
jgi:hypothetical protein